MWCTSSGANVLLGILIGQRGKRAILLLASNVSPTTIVASLAFLVLCLDLGMTKKLLSWIQTWERFVKGGFVALGGNIMMSTVKFVPIEVRTSFATMGICDGRRLFARIPESLVTGSRVASPQTLGVSKRM